MNLPNILTSLRICLIPVIVATFYWNTDLAHIIGTSAFVLACFTDFLDGYVARTLKQTSKLGQWLDPIADKLLICSTILFLAGFQRISSFGMLAALIILCREVFISNLRGRMHKLEVIHLSKWKTVAQMFALGILLFSRDSQLSNIGEIGLWFAAILTMITGYRYLSLGIID